MREQTAISLVGNNYSPVLVDAHEVREMHSVAYHHIVVSDTLDRTPNARIDKTSRLEKSAIIAAGVLLLSFVVMAFDFSLGSVLGMPAFAYLLAVARER